MKTETVIYKNEKGNLLAISNDILDISVNMGGMAIMSDIILSKVEEVATTVGVAPSTIRKYSQLLEKYGYEFARNNQNAFMYDDDEIKMLKEFAKLKKQKDITLDMAAQQILIDVAGMEISVSNTSTNSADMQAMVKAMSDMQEKMNIIIEQNNKVLEENNTLNKRLEQIEETKLLENNRLDERDKTLMEVVRGLQDVKKEIAVSNEKNNRKWYEFWKA